MSAIKSIVLHCSDSTHGCAREIRRWHRERGWSDIGYHFVIENGTPVQGLTIEALDGSIECGRILDGSPDLIGDEIGAHALGHNADSIGVCLIGRDAFTDAQWRALLGLLMDLCTIYHIDPDNVIGHYETESGRAQGKICPNFDVPAFREVLKHEMYSGGKA
jgi:hypothetical protein